MATFDSLRETYLQLISDCTPDAVTDEIVLTFLSEIKGVLKDSQSDPSHGPTTRIALTTLCQRAPWLSNAVVAQLEDAIGEQQEFIDENFRFTFDMGSGHMKRWREELACFAGQPDLQFLEIGTAEGMTACWLLQNILTHETSRLSCVDLFADPGGTMQIAAGMESRFDYNIARAAGSKKVTKLKGTSRTVLRTLPLNNYDFAYVDGSHDTADVLEDAVLVWPLLKTNAILIFDDYEYPDAHGPKLAIDTFIEVFQRELELVHRGYQVTLKKSLQPR